MPANIVRTNAEASDRRAPPVNLRPEDLASQVVIVLGLGVTGLAVVRSLVAAGIRVYGVSFSRLEPGRVTRLCTVIDRPQLDSHGAELCDWLRDFAGQLGSRPIVFPTSDDVALALASHSVELRASCRIWQSGKHHLEMLVRKDKLYGIASRAGVSIPPTLISPRLGELREWCLLNPAPYLVKPYYASHPNAECIGKNAVFETATDMLEFLERIKNQASGMIIQQVIAGGDGWIFDCYGLCDRNGDVKTMITHRRVRQYLPNFGITCFGEIPADPVDCGRDEIFRLTERILGQVHYHGIFGIEWLQDRDTKRLFLLDVNARPFYTIGHLRDCGVDLPVLAVRELLGDDLNDLEPRPDVKPMSWIDLGHDLGTMFRTRHVAEAGFLQWAASALKCRSYALWSSRDPMPAIRALFDSFLSVIRNLCNSLPKR